MPGPKLPYRELSPETYGGTLYKRICVNCTETFWAYSWKKNAKYCSRQCGQSHKGRSSARERGDAQRDRGEGKTYRKRNGIHEHRLVAEEKIGRKLKPEEVVHHVNGDKRDNRPENLEVLPSQSEHIEEHREEMNRARGIE